MNHSARFLICLCACLAFTHCSQSVAPAPFDSDVPLDAAGPDARTDGANAPDSAGARDGADDVSFQRASVVWVTQSGGFRATGRILSPTPVDTELPTPVGGCEVIAPRLSAMVSDGTLSIEWNGQQRQIPFGENREYYDVLMPMPLAPGELVTARFSGSSTHPDFLLEGRMPPAMPAVLTPSQSGALPFRDDEPFLVRWNVVAASDFVRVQLFGIAASTPNNVTINCMAPISRGELRVPVETLRVLRDFPRQRALWIARFTDVRAVVRGAPVILRVSDYSQQVSILFN